MAIDIFIKFDGIEGEAAHRDHKEWIEVLSWAWGLSVQTSGGGGGGGGRAGKASPHDFSFTHRYDKASPLLANHAASGTAIKEATLAVGRAGDVRADYLKISMTNILISSVVMSGSVDEGIVESVSARCRQIAFEYKPANAKGQLGPPVTFSWDIAANKVT